MIKQYKLRFYNFRLLLFLLAISSIGVVLVGTAREDLMLKQLMGVIMGLVIMVILSLIDYSWISNFQWIMYGSNIVLLLIVRLLEIQQTARRVGSISVLSGSSLQSLPKLSSFSFLPGFLWIMKKI